MCVAPMRAIREMLAASRVRLAGQPACGDTRAGEAPPCLAGRRPGALPPLAPAVSTSPRGACAPRLLGRAHASLGPCREVLRGMVVAARPDCQVYDHMPAIARIALRLASLRLLARACGALARLEPVRTGRSKW